MSNKKVTIDKIKMVINIIGLNVWILKELINEEEMIRK